LERNLDKDDFLRRFAETSAPDLGGFAEGGAGGSSVRKEEGQVLYRICKVFGPRRIIETGTHTGCSTNYLLAYAREQGATVFSFDVESRAGADIREELKENLVLVKPRARLLGRGVTDRDVREIREAVVRTAREGVDLFFHDSDHRYENARWEFDNITPHMRPGSPVILHDVLNSSDALQTCRLFDEISCAWKHVFDTPNGLGLAVL